MGKDRHPLEIRNLHLYFVGLNALDGVSFHVKDGKILAVFVLNGAGKTSLLNCINGFYRPQQGKIVFEEKPITQLPPYKIAKRGISRTFQNKSKDCRRASRGDQGLLGGRRTGLRGNGLSWKQIPYRSS